VQALPHNGPTLMKAQWPASGCHVDAAALEQYEALKQLVRGVRNARLEYGLEQARKVRPGVGGGFAQEGFQPQGEG
jgi:valyl-tRNA synthetase